MSETAAVFITCPRSPRRRRVDLALAPLDTRVPDLGCGEGRDSVYFASGELGDIYAVWLALGYEEGLIGCSHHGISHFHSVEQLVASVV